jgi:hypothetical protein
VKPFFEDAGEVEHVIGLTKNPGFNATLADMLREHAIAAGVPAHWLDDAPQLLAPPYEPGYDVHGMPLDPAHPWNGGPGYGVNLNSRQWAIVEALAAAENGSDISAPLLALHAVETDAAVAALVPAAEHGKKFPGRKPGAVSLITKEVAAYLRKHPTASAMEVWGALAKKPPKGFCFMDSQRLGRYIERGPNEVMKWERFKNIVSEQRPSELKRTRRNHGLPNP